MRIEYMAYLTPNNFEKCKSAFSKWMRDNYDLDIASVQQIDFNAEMYKTMKAINSEYATEVNDNVSLYNNVALNNMQKRYVETLRLARKTLPMSEQGMATRLSVSTDNIASAFDSLMNLRRDESASVPEGTIPFVPEKEETMPASDFETKMKQLASERQRDYLSANVQLQQSIPAREEVDITKILMPSPPVSSSVADNNPATSDIYVNRAQQDIIPKPQTTTTTNAYITINGFDRDITKYKLRYQFAVNVTDFMRNYKNINCITFSTIILPMEIYDCKSTNNPQPKVSYFHEQKFGYPYLLLQVDELVNVYDGLNDQVRRSVAQFILDSCYKCPNGRGYIILKPAQCEHRHLPQPLSSLQRLSFSIIKPNGALFNTSDDSLNVIQVLYEVYNTLYLKITTDKFFDKNEFFIGDNVMFKNVQITPSPSWTPSACVTSTSEYTRLNSFLNRSEGHDVLQLGDANDNGFYRSFYINAPQYLDGAQGKMIVDKPLVDVTREYNAAFPVNLSSPAILGQIINLSLQPTISFKMSTETFTPLSVPAFS